MQLAVLGGSGLLSGGFMFKAAILGASIAGSMILNGNKKPVGKLNDLRVSSSSYGRGIPKVWGSMRVTGNMFWATDFREEKIYMTQKGKSKTGVKGEKKSKKGKATPIYKYYANFAMGLCEGPMDQVVRIWADNNLIYNKLNPDDEDVVGPGFSLETEEEDSGKRSQKSMQGKKGNNGESGQFAFTFYSGDEDQKPDPYMESVQGNGNVPAYRGLCYLMFEDFALEDFGNRIPTITAEVITKTKRRAQILKFENMDPYQPDYWDRQVWSAGLDVANGNLVVQAHKQGGGKVFRIYDMSTRKEINRLDLNSVLPQTAVHGQPIFPIPGQYVGSEIKTWDRPNGMELFCLTPKGHMCLYQMEGNVSPVAFMDYMNGNIVKGWGKSGAYGNYNGWPWDGIFAPGGAFPVLCTDDQKGYARAFTCVNEIFGRIHVFDEYYNKIHEIVCGGRRGYHRQGVMGTDHGVYFATANGGSGATSYTIYWATISTTMGNDQEEHRLGQWPEQAGSRGGVLILYDMAYIVGANCVGLIAGNAGDDAYAVKMDAYTGEILWEKRLEGVNTNFNLNGFVSPKTHINTNGWTIQNNQHIIKIDFHMERVTVQALQEGVSYPSQATFPRYYWSERDAFIGFVREDTGEVVPTILYQDRVTQSKVNIGAICKDVSERVGIPSDQISVAGVASQEDIVGYMFEQPTDARSILQELANTFQFDCVESDDTLIFKMRGGDPVITIPEKLLGVVESEFGSDNERLVETTQHQLELPERVTVSFYNPKHDYETGSQYYKRPSRPIPVMSTREHYEVTFNMAMLNSQAKSLAKRILYAAWSERTTQQFKLPRDFLLLDPSDVVRIELNDGRALECRITDVTQGANMELEVTSVSNLPDSYTHNEVADADTGTIKQPGGYSYFASPEIMNIPYIDDADENRDTNLGFYWAARASKPGFNYGLLMSRHDTTDWAAMGATTLDAIWGYTSDLVPPPASGWNTEDTKTKITLIPAFDFNATSNVITWESETDEEWPSGKNMIIVDNEIILFKDVVEDPITNRITISRLIRGHRGSVAAAYSHTLRSPWVRYTADSVHHDSDALDYLNRLQDFIIQAGNPLAPLFAMHSTKLDGGTERPLPVGDVRRINMANGDHKIKWSRSTRVGGALKDSTASVPLNEENERYQVFLLDKDAKFNANTFNPDASAHWKWKSEILTTSEIVIPKQVPLDAGYNSGPITLKLVIYQLSTSVHWGFPLIVDLPYALIGV